MWFNYIICAIQLYYMCGSTILYVRFKYIIRAVQLYYMSPKDGNKKVFVYSIMLYTQWYLFYYKKRITPL